MKNTTALPLESTKVLNVYNGVITKQKNCSTHKTFRLHDPASSITHFIGMVGALIGAAPLIIRAAESGTVSVIAQSVFILSMIFLYGASSFYHGLNVVEKKRVPFQKLDHMMIYVLIAGSYTPVFASVFGGTKGIALLCVIWGIAFAGILMNAFWITCPKWFSSVIYITMGWTAAFVMVPLHKLLSSAAFGWLLAGGIVYTIGGIIYALKLPIFNAKFKDFGSHEIFHLFVMGGSLCHYIFMYFFVA